MKKLGHKSRIKNPRLLAFAAIGLIVVGSGYAAATMDIAYSAKSLMAAAVSALDTTPRVVISRSASSPTKSILPKDRQVIAVFDIVPKNLGTTTVALNNLVITAALNADSSVVNAGNLGLRYAYCPYDRKCVSTDLKVDVAKVPATTPMPDVPVFLNMFAISPVGGSLPVYPAASSTVATLSVIAYPSYPTIYNSTNTPTASIKAYVSTSTASATGTWGSTRTVLTKSIPVDFSLAYGSALPITRGAGYAYGVWDINNNGALLASDADYVLKVAVGTLKCPLFKQCDINKSGAVTATDANLLLKYAVGSLPPPSATGTLTVSEAANNPAAAKIGISSSVTSGVLFQSFNVIAKNQDVNISSFSVSLKTSDNNLSDVVSSVKLLGDKGTTVLSSKPVGAGSTATVTFDNINQKILKDTGVGYMITVDLKGNAAYANGTTLAVSTPTAWGAYDINGVKIAVPTYVWGSTMTLTSF